MKSFAIIISWMPVASFRFHAKWINHCEMLSQTGVVASGILTMKDATSIAVPARSTRNGGDPASFPLGLRPSSLTWPFVQTRTRYSVTAIGIEKYRLRPIGFVRSALPLLFQEADLSAIIRGS
jgi:hypothetical protein